MQVNVMAIGAVLGVLASAGAAWQFAGDVADALPYAKKADIAEVQQQVIELAGDVIQLKKGETRRAILSNQQLRYDNLREQRQYEQQGELPPQEVLEDAENLEAERKRLRQELEELEAIRP